MNNLLQIRRFFPLLITQFLGALNDNLFKNALLTLVALKMAAQSHILSNVIAGLFILPFFLFSAWAGEFADKFSRHKIARVLKLVEIVLMCGVAVAYHYSSLPALIAIMCIMGTQSAFFGPVKYALLPQQLEPNELIAGNAYIEATTYLAILLGLMLGTLLPINISIAILILLAVLGYLSARLILPAPAPRPNLTINRNIFAAVWDNFRFLKRHRYLLQSILGASWFWMIGSLAAVQIYPLCGKILNAGEGTITFFLILFSLGVAMGSYACNRLLRGNIDTTYVPLSAVGMSLCLFALSYFSYQYPTSETTLKFTEFLLAPRAVGISLSLFLMAFFGGLYIIPLNAFMQNRSPKAYTASVIAGNNLFNALGMTLMAVFAIIVFKTGFSLPQLFFMVGIISLAVALYVCSLLPDALSRSILQTILKFMFRTQVKGISRFYKAGKKVLIVSNHTSLWDGVLLAAFMPERITFAITSAWTEKWFMPIIRILADFYPVDPANPLSLRTLIEEIKNGRKVMMFPEGRITLTGKTMQMYDGAAMIAAKSGAKLLPVRINGAQYSKLSYVKDKFRTRWFPKIDIHILEARKFEMSMSKTGRNAAARKLYELMSEMIFLTSDKPSGFFEALQGSAHIHGQNHIIACDILQNTCTYRQLLHKASLWGEWLRLRLKGKQNIGILLPSGLNFLIIFSALQYLGKNIVILDEKNLTQQTKESKTELIISAGEISNVDCPVMTYLQIKPRIADFFSRKKACSNPFNEVIFFNNGKIIRLQTHLLLKNFRQLDCVLPFNPSDIALNCLPPHMGEGFVLGTILPLLNGVKTCFCHGLNAKVIPHLAYDIAATAFFADNETIENCTTFATSYDFFNIRLAFSFNGKLDGALMETWLKNFGIRILENYTDSSSVTIKAINTPLYYRFGSLGCRLPGIKEEFLGILTDTDGFCWKDKN